MINDSRRWPGESVGFVHRGAVPAESPAALVSAQESIHYPQAGVLKYRHVPPEVPRPNPRDSRFAHIREDFPILSRKVNGYPLVWFDNAATTQKPQSVIDAVNRFYTEYNSNIHRGAHTFEKLATKAYEDAREMMRKFLGAANTEEIVFTSGTTESINLVAASWGGANLREGDEILLTQMEHTSNIVPWQLIAQKTGAIVKAVPVTERGEIRLDEYRRMFTRRTRIASAAHVSNVLGTVNPVREMTEIAHAHGALILIDGAQSTPHLPVNVNSIGADFYALSSHKMYGPMGSGVLYGKKELLESMPVYQGGGGMTQKVTFNGSTFLGPPIKFEAGTPSVADAIGLGAASQYLTRLGMENVKNHELELTQYLMRGFSKIPGLRIIGTAPGKISVVSFVLENIRPEAISDRINKFGIEIRNGYQCARPLLTRFGLDSVARASIGLYNNIEELDKLIDAVRGMAR